MSTPTGFDPGRRDPQLQAKLDDGMRQLQQLGLDLANKMPPVTGGGTTAAATTNFQAAESARTQVQLLPDTSGQNVIENLTRIHAARIQRVATLERAFAAGANGSGSNNPADAKKLEYERETTEQLGRMIARIAPHASTIDRNEALLLTTLVNNANATGVFSASDLALVDTQIIGSAANLPAGYMDTLRQVIGRLGSAEMQVALHADAALEDARRTGTIIPERMQSLERAHEDIGALSRAIRRNFDSAPNDVAGATARMQQALSQPTIQGMTAALG